VGRFAFFSSLALLIFVLWSSSLFIVFVGTREEGFMPAFWFLLCVCAIYACLRVCAYVCVWIQRTRISCVPRTWMRQVRSNDSVKRSRRKHSEACRRKLIKSVMRRQNMC
jgi:hypothetical protein